MQLTFDSYTLPAQAVLISASVELTRVTESAHRYRARTIREQEGKSACNFRFPRNIFRVTKVTPETVRSLIRYDPGPAPAHPLLFQPILLRWFHWTLPSRFISLHFHPFSFHFHSTTCDMNKDYAFSSSSFSPSLSFYFSVTLWIVSRPENSEDDWESIIIHIPPPPPPLSLSLEVLSVAVSSGTDL